MTLALLFAGLSWLFFGEVIPLSDRFASWHGSVMGVLSLLLAAFFGGCAWRGFRR